MTAFQVICRIRPPTSDEIAAEVPTALEALGDGELGVKIVRDGARPGGQGAGTGAGGSGSTSWRSFTLDRVLGPSTTQQEVFREVSENESESEIGSMKWRCFLRGGVFGCSGVWRHKI